jgi:hypothetical protein
VRVPHSSDEAIDAFDLAIALCEDNSDAFVHKGQARIHNVSHQVATCCNMPQHVAPCSSSVRSS